MIQSQPDQFLDAPGCAPEAARTSDPDVTIAALLTQAQQAHVRAQVCRKAKNVVGHWECISEAYQCRMDAEARDPERRDPAWKAEQAKKFNHLACVQFYRHELGIPEP